MRYVYLEKSDLDKMIQHLKKEHRVVAPVAKENLFVFADVENAEEITLEYLPTILPPKKYFFPPKQVLGEFTMGETKMSSTTVEVEPTVIFAAHTCDIDGMECLHTVFRNDPVDPYYKKIEKEIAVIGYECMFPCDECATCVTMDTHVPKAGYDAMMTDAGDKFIIHINSKKGDALISNNPIFKEVESGTAKEEIKKLRAAKLKKFDVKLKASYSELPGIFADSYDSDVWEGVGKRCVSCGNCTAVCPTCYCFDMYDEVKLDISGGERKRVWDSCQLEEFAEVAGNENFREERSSRQRHRYYRKFDYPVKKYNKFFCTGCGRCTRACMAEISLVETVNDITKENKNV
ncbi:MAG: 4Fe-4S dicluster domain-containing protein [Candidatus Tantalella remota]|nr:4Fe-4S dicluster domain-containing protein [Candidatus Tantalella remota]